MTYHKYATPDEGAWTYSDGAPVVEPAWATLASLQAAHRGHWFDAATLRWFGSQRRELIAGCIVVELQAKAPEGMPRYAVTPFGPDASPVGIVCRHATRALARACARRVAAEGLHVLPDENE